MIRVIFLLKNKPQGVLEGTFMILSFYSYIDDFFGLSRDMFAHMRRLFFDSISVVSFLLQEVPS